MRAAYLGPPGTFSEEALLASATGTRRRRAASPSRRSPTSCSPCRRAAPSAGSCRSRARREGSVDATLDALAERRARRRDRRRGRCGPVRHALVARDGVALDDVAGRRVAPAGARAVRAVPALASCRTRARWRGRRPPRRCARRPSRAGEGWAAIGTPRAAELYGCDGAARRASRTTPATRRASSGSRRAGRRARGAGRATKTSLVFRGAGAGEPGWLVRCLSEFAFRGVNLTRIESRPRKDRLGDYLFFVDSTGAIGRRARRRGGRGPARPLRPGARPGLVSGGVSARTPRLHFALRPWAAVPPAPTGFAPLAEHQRRGRAAGRVLVLNATYEPINVCTVRRADVLLLKEKAEVIEHASWTLRSEHTQHAAADGDPAGDLREGPARHAPPQDHPPRRLRPRRLDVPVLRRALEPHRRPRHPALQGRLVGVGQHRRLVRAVQPAQGRPAARAGEHDPRAARRARRSPQVFIHVASPTIPAAWKQWLPDTSHSVTPSPAPAGASTLTARRRRSRLGTTKGARSTRRPSHDLHWTDPEPD